MSANEKYYARANVGRRCFTLSDAESLLPPAGTHPRSTGVYAHGNMLLKLFAPRGHDPQPNDGPGVRRDQSDLVHV